MKKLNNKKGFTLVECIVAMAVLAIMSLLLMMILNITVLSRNKNMSLEKELDEQIGNIVAAGAESASYTKSIAFEMDGTIIDTIPPADTVNEIEAANLYQTGYDIELDALKYDFQKYKVFDDIKKGGVVGSSVASTTTFPLVYGAVDIANSAIIHIEEYAKNLLKENPSDPTEITGYDVTLEVKFYVNSGSPEKGLKIKIPDGNYDVSFDKSYTYNAVNVVAISKDTVRIQPANGTNESFNTTSPPLEVKTYIKFKISKDDYNNKFKSVADFYSNGSGGSAVDITIETTA